MTWASLSASNAVVGSSRMMINRSPRGFGIAAGDIFGALTEAYANQSASFDPPDYTVGEEITVGGGGPLRYMHAPSLRGQANCYSTQLPATDSGPISHWFYLLAEGSKPSNGQPQSPTCNGSQTWGVGIRAAGLGRGQRPGGH